MEFIARQYYICTLYEHKKTDSIRNWLKISTNYKRLISSLTNAWFTCKVNVMEDLLNIDWEAEFSNHQGDVQAQWDILMSKLRQAEEQCIPKKRISQRARKCPVPLDVKTRAKIKRKNRLWKKFLLTKDVQNYQEFCRLRNQVRRPTRKAQKQY